MSSSLHQNRCPSWGWVGLPQGNGSKPFTMEIRAESLNLFHQQHLLVCRVYCYIKTIRNTSVFAQGYSVPTGERGGTHGAVCLSRCTCIMWDERHSRAVGTYSHIHPVFVCSTYVRVLFSRPENAFGLRMPQTRGASLTNKRAPKSFRQHLGVSDFDKIGDGSGWC